MINVGDRRAGDFGRVRINGDIVRPGVAGANAAAAQDDNNSDNNSNGTVFSDIPEEDGFSFANQNQIRFSCWNRFEDTQLYMKFIQWEKNSHGLFDYEMANTKKKFLWTNKNKVVLREGLNIHFVDTESYNKRDYSSNYQEIFRI